MIWRKYSQKTSLDGQNQFYTNAFKEHKDDTRYLYTLMAILTVGSSVNPMPECESDEKLAENFVNFFLGKKTKN